MTSVKTSKKLHSDFGDLQVSPNVLYHTVTHGSTQAAKLLTNSSLSTSHLDYPSGNTSRTNS